MILASTASAGRIPADDRTPVNYNASALDNNQIIYCPFLARLAPEFFPSPKLRHYADDLIKNSTRCQRYKSITFKRQFAG